MDAVDCLHPRRIIVQHDDLLVEILALFCQHRIDSFLVASGDILEQFFFEYLHDFILTLHAS